MKDKIISVRISEEEYDRLRVLAKESNSSVSVYARNALLKNNVVFVDKASEILNELANMSSEITRLQIKNSEVDFEKLKERVSSLWKLLK